MRLLSAVWLWVVGLWRRVFGKKAVDVNSLPLEMPKDAPGAKEGGPR